MYALILFLVLFVLLFLCPDQRTILHDRWSFDNALRSLTGALLVVVLGKAFVVTVIWAFSV